MFFYLADKFDITIVVNDEFNIRNNNSSIYAVREHLKNSYICSADNYFTDNPFENEVDDSYYAALYADGETDEWCISEGEDGYINHVQIGGRDSWYMLGHVFWNNEFSKKFIGILEKEYFFPSTSDLLWESIYMNNLNILKLRIRRYSNDQIFEFDTLEELRLFDSTYLQDSRSTIIKSIADDLSCSEDQIVDIIAVKSENSQEATGFCFSANNVFYQYDYVSKNLMRQEL